MEIPDLRIPPAPKRLVWTEVRMRQVVVHGVLVQVAVERQAIVVFVHGAPLASWSVAEEPGTVVYTNHAGQARATMDLDKAREMIATCTLSDATKWRGEVAIGDVLLEGWQQHLHWNGVAWGALPVTPP